ncbi:hypothetical protein [Chryseobacterium sp. JK1]|uniref:hypothetical protein n=1 Tax=Chryseobacterium sp. JK1 TaxID=874294 RepID=UPI003D69696F
MTKPSLELPTTIRFLHEDEIPLNNPSVLKRWQESKTANIVQGYTLTVKDDDNDSLGFRFYSEINIDNSNLWKLIIALSKTLPDIAAFLFGYIDFDLNYGRYVEKESLLEYIAQYKNELAQDAFINFGLIYNDEEVLIEIFIDESKYIKYWGVDEEQFKVIMNEFGLEEIEKLEFIDEYPKVREVLTRLDDKALDSKILIELFAQKYL